ncbi:LAETG motif-containing sortase-dependent surface protein [Streptomyces sp. NPDC127105]|uniref:LAETG motif-containing sortase-dependent surface protein n=1 Tax=Streptomyces sp. NPDC127105 TaxID=3345359 RepID=UPI00364BE79C
MKIRRYLALAAATAAITPAVFLAAPAAFATDGNPDSSSSTPASTDSESAALSGSDAKTEGDGSDTKAEDGSDTKTEDGSDTTEGGSDTKTEDGSDTTEGGSDTKTEDGSDTTEGGSDSKGEGTTDEEPATPSPSASPSETPGPQVCNDSEDYTQDKNLHTSLSGLPSQIVAGSGFHNFKLNVNNSGHNAYKRVDLGVFAAQVNEKNHEVTTSYLTLQYKDPATGTWQNISLNENDEGAGYLGYTDVQAKESFSIDLRLSIDRKAPAGMGFAISIGMYADDKGNCVYSSDDDFYQFDVLAAGSKSGNPGDAKPQGGRKPLPAKPAGDNQIVPQGHLAETGSNSALPMIALAGGAAVAVGTGAVFVVRRRKADIGATA